MKKNQAAIDKRYTTIKKKPLIYTMERTCMPTGRQLSILMVPPCGFEFSC